MKIHVVASMDGAKYEYYKICFVCSCFIDHNNLSIPHITYYAWSGGQERERERILCTAGSEYQVLYM